MHTVQYNNICIKKLIKLKIMFSPNQHHNNNNVLYLYIYYVRGN